MLCLHEVRNILSMFIVNIFRQYIYIYINLLLNKIDKLQAVHVNLFNG